MNETSTTSLQHHRFRNNRNAVLTNTGRTKVLTPTRNTHLGRTKPTNRTHTAWT